MDQWNFGSDIISQDQFSLAHKFDLGISGSQFDLGISGLKFGLGISDSQFDPGVWDHIDINKNNNFAV